MSKEQEILVTIPVQVFYYRSEVEDAFQNVDPDFEKFLFHSYYDNVMPKKNYINELIEWLHQADMQESFLEYNDYLLGNRDAYLRFVAEDYVGRLLEEYATPFSLYQGDC